MSTVVDSFGQHFFRLALIEAVMVGAVAGAVGVHVLLRRLPFFAKVGAFGVNRKTPCPLRPAHRQHAVEFSLEAGRPGCAVLGAASLFGAIVLTVLLFGACGLSSRALRSGFGLFGSVL